MFDPFELHSDMKKIGKDPRKITQAQLKELGHAPMSPIDAIRARCVDCCGGSKDEVRKCTAVACPSWPFRMGTSPWRNPRNLSEKQREEMAERLKAARQARAVENR